MLDWTPYDHYQWTNRDQKRMGPAKRGWFEKLAADILELSPVSAGPCWGTVSAPGRNALVIRIHPNVPHRFARHGTSLGLKIFNLKDGKIMWPSISRFHREQRQRLPGLPHRLVQEVFKCGARQTAEGIERGYLIQPWMEGQILEEKFKAGVSPAEAWHIFDDLFLELLIPLWGVGSSWWDVRESDYVFTPDQLLVMIDSDTLGGYADEIINTPAVYRRRNNGTLTAMKRYSTWIIALACRHAERGKQGQTGRLAKNLIQQHLVPVFCRPIRLLMVGVSGQPQLPKSPMKFDNPKNIIKARKADKLAEFNLGARKVSVRAINGPVLKINPQLPEKTL